MGRGVLRRRGSVVRVDGGDRNCPVHIVVRYEIERRVVSGRRRVPDPAEPWDDAMDARLGQRPSGDVDGVLQDMHWAVGSFGYFPAYLLGSAIAAQL